MSRWFSNPAVVFVIVLALLFLLNRLFSILAYRSNKPKADSCESYACGESNFDNSAQPDYSQFFPFAFFFTLAHVATLMIATMHFVNIGALVIALFYIISSVVGLYVLLRK
ncbi:MAG: hypothetical protein PHY88_01565 [Candidatus Omnitrophica bacterium]|nr:hypothetical protein [Candidatus Omnitrophota bacterium]